MADDPIWVDDTGPRLLAALSDRRAAEIRDLRRVMGAPGNSCPIRSKWVS